MAPAEKENNNRMAEEKTNINDQAKKKTQVTLGWNKNIKTKITKKNIFLGIFHALHHLATKSAKTVWAKYCDGIHKFFLKKQIEKQEEHKLFGQKESGWGV